MAHRLQEQLDSEHARAADGGMLWPLSGDPEEKLSQARKAESIRARSEALHDVVRAEPVRRLTRKAGLTAYATSSPDARTDVVLKTLRQITDVVLFNLCRELTRICEHQRRKVVTEDLLREALKSFQVKLHGACEHRHSACSSLKRHRRASPRTTSGNSEAEILHERNNDSCVCFAYAPFAKLVRMYMREQSTLDNPVKMSRGVLSCIQLVVEQSLVEVLERARYLMRQTTKKKSDTSSPTRQTLFARDLRTVLVTLGHRHPLLSGRLRPALADPPVPRAKAKAKAKGGPARAKAAARAKRG